MRLHVYESEYFQPEYGPHVFAFVPMDCPLVGGWGDYVIYNLFIVSHYAQSTKKFTWCTTGPFSCKRHRERKSTPIGSIGDWFSALFGLSFIIACRFLKNSLHLLYCYLICSFGLLSDHKMPTPMCSRGFKQNRTKKYFR